MQHGVSEVESPVEVVADWTFFPAPQQPFKVYGKWHTLQPPKDKDFIRLNVSIHVSTVCIGNLAMVSARKQFQHVKIYESLRGPLLRPSCCFDPRTVMSYLSVLMH